MCTWERNVVVKFIGSRFKGTGRLKTVIFLLAAGARPLLPPPACLGFKGWEYAWLEQVLGDGCGSREMILGYTLRLAGICGLCVVVVVSLRRSVRCVRG